MTYIFKYSRLQICYYHNCQLGGWLRGIFHAVAKYKNQRMLFISNTIQVLLDDQRAEGPSILSGYPRPSTSTA